MLLVRKSSSRGHTNICPRQLSQNTSICEYELFKRQEWLTDALASSAIGSSEKTFLFIDSERFGSEPVLPYHLPCPAILGTRAP